MGLQMGLNEELERMKFDTRLIDWHLKYKRLITDELTRHLSQLPDCSNNVETFSFAGENSGDEKPSREF